MNTHSQMGQSNELSEESTVLLVDHVEQVSNVHVVLVEHEVLQCHAIYLVHRYFTG